MSRFDVIEVGPYDARVIDALDPEPINRISLGVGISATTGQEARRLAAYLNQHDPDKWDGLNWYRNPGKPTPDPMYEPREIHRMAYQYLTRHDHAPSDNSRLTRENCAACCLAGYQSGDEDVSVHGPNVSGWARLYVEAQRPIPRWIKPGRGSARRAMWPERALDSLSPDYDNQPYAAAFARSIVTFGIRFGDPTMEQFERETIVWLPAQEATA
jgi:hypothetical protein